jgi:Sulfotransferase family
MDIRSVVPLDENSLLRCAKHNTGLSDFGADDWYEPFQVLIKALEEEAQLNLIGRLLTRSELLILLEARLRIEDTYKRHPEIEEERIEKPLMIIGQARTGTSAMQNTLAEDPDNGTLRVWESMFPCPPPEKATYRTDPRIEKADKLITAWNRINPNLVAMHEFSGDIPQESVQIDSINFMSPSWLNLLGQVPSYNAYMATKSYVPVYSYEKRILKLLQWKNPRKHWVLKAMNYMYYMPDVLRVFPDACFVWTHRDPIRALASSVSIIGTFNWIRSDVPFIDGAYEETVRTDVVAATLDQPIDWLEKGVVAKERLCNVDYRDFTRDPIGVAQRIYDFFGIPLTAQGRAAMQQYMDERPRSSRPEHRYDTGSESLIEEERRAFKRYQEYFNVPSEL